jgi:endonuclease YncB( thermonuclease family)
MANVTKTATYYIYDQVSLLNIVDGDTIDTTITVDIGFNTKTSTTVRIRVHAFDAPESYRPKTAAEKQHGEEAKAYATSLLKGGVKALHTYKEAAYDRWEADVILPDGTNFATRMREAGMEKRKEY